MSKAKRLYSKECDKLEDEIREWEELRKKDNLDNMLRDKRINIKCKTKAQKDVIK